MRTLNISGFSARVYRLVFFLAAAYNIIFGVWAALFPRHFFELFALAPPRYPSIWACLGMVVGLYGLFYWFAARNLDRGYPLIAIGLAGKLLGPVGWILAVGRAELPFRTLPLIVFNDLIWWTPFAMFLIEGSALSRLIKRSTPLLCAATHVVAAVCTVLLLRGGMAYVGGSVDMWRLGWVFWMVAAVALAGFYVWWGRRVAQTTAALAALLVAVGGLVCDFAGESILIAFVPQQFTTLSRWASLLMGGAANGLYTAAGVILTLVTPMPRWLRVWSWLVWSAGAALTVATILDVPAGVVFSSAALMTLFIPWLVAAGRVLR